MKIKMSDKSIRFRFSKNELQELQVGHRIEMEVDFSLNQKITFLVDIEKKSEAIFLSYVNEIVSLRIPVHILEDVIKSPSKDGFEASFPVGENKNMKIQIQCDLRH